MSRARWSRKAQDDLATIDDHYRILSSDYADRIGIAAIAAGRFLASHPRAGAMLGDRVERKWRVPKSPYSLIYRIEPHGVLILRVIHGASDWKARY